MTVPPMLISAGTTNYIRNPRGATDAANWVMGNGTLGRAASDHELGTMFIMTATGTASASMAEVGTAHPAGQGQATALSAWVRGSGVTIGKFVRLRVTESGGSGASATVAETTHLLTGDWQRVSASGHVAGSDRTAVAAVLILLGPTAGEVMHLTGIQLEPTTFPTAYTDTTRPARYSPGSMQVGNTHIGPMRVGRR